MQFATLAFPAIETTHPNQHYNDKKGQFPSAKMKIRICPESCRYGNDWLIFFAGVEGILLGLSLLNYVVANRRLSMATAIKTPGVYIRELDAFPNSVVEVPTAVPAFFGYTEKVPVKNNPTRISTMREFEAAFGGAPQPRFTFQDVDHITPVDNTQFLLYYSMQLFFANGGGPCWIVSTGTYAGAATAKSLKDFYPDRLAALEKILEPTMLVAPDAVLLKIDEWQSLCQQFLAHCNKMQSRVSILDVFDGDQPRDYEDDDVIDVFRDRVASDFLNYGQAYYPWVNSSIVDSSAVDYGMIDDDSLGKLQDALKAPLSNLLDSAKKPLSDLIDQMAPSIRQALRGALTSVQNKDNATLRNKFRDLISQIGATTDQAKLTDLQTKLTTLAAPLAAATKTTITAAAANVADPDPQKKAQAVADLKKAIATVVDPASQASASLGILDQMEQANADMGALKGQLNTAVANIGDPSLSADLKAILGKMAATDSQVAALTSAADAISNDASKQEIKTILGNMAKWGANMPRLLSQLTDAASRIPDPQERADFTKLPQPPLIGPTVTQIHQALMVVSPTYVKIMGNIQKQLNTLPPAAGMAGVYTRIDNSIGVFKAPANTTMNSVVTPTVDLTNDEQDDLNAPLDGKAINAIRTFPGRGVLIWGARTLDGNSDDWRYINVRRTIIMLEQSIKYATLAYVFEPNNAGTWVTVKNMISNFLTNQWKSGALVGAKPEEAYTVDVGLGSTMTGEDILQGFMYVTVRVALVRPAEFIVITFQQKMQTS
jgi:phage tail sheath protein FI